MVWFRLATEAETHMLAVAGRGDIPSLSLGYPLQVKLTGTVEINKAWDVSEMIRDDYQSGKDERDLLCCGP